MHALLKLRQDLTNHVIVLILTQTAPHKIMIYYADQMNNAVMII